MNKKTTGIIAYITWIGWIVAFCAGDKEGAKFHLNQALVILIGQIVAAVINYIPYVGRNILRTDLRMLGMDEERVGQTGLESWTILVLLWSVRRCNTGFEQSNYKLGIQR